MPASTISSLSFGEFVGIVADNPDQPIELKAFYSRIVNNHAAIKKEKKNFHPLRFVRNVVKAEIDNTHLLIKQDALDIVDAVMEQVLNDPGMEGLVVRKNN